MDIKDPEFFDLSHSKPVATGEISFLYRCLLGREPRQEEIVTAGKILKPSHLIAVLLASDEFHAKVCLATDRDVVSLYHELLKRLPESEDMVSLNVGRPLLEIAIGFARSEEYRAIVRHTDDDDIVRMFRAILGREPESEDVRASFRGRPVVEVAIELAKSQEYQSGILLQATTIGRMYSALFPASKIPANWFQRFAIMLHTHAVSFPQLMSYLSELVLYQRGVQAGDGSVDRSLRTSRKALKNFDSRIAVVIPTVNSARWLGHVIDYYRNIDLKVIFAVDTRTSDGTTSLLSAKGSKFVMVRGQHPRVESLIGEIVAKVDAEWILRIDDDELPSPGMLRWADKVIGAATPTTWGFPRVYCRYDVRKRELEYSQFLPIGPLAGRDRQWRLFRRNEVELSDRLHTPGFVAHKKRPAPDLAILFHFDWVVRSRLMRAQKVKTYEEQDAELARSLAHLSLYETVPKFWHMFTPLNFEPYQEFARKAHF